MPTATPERRSAAPPRPAAAPPLVPEAAPRVDALDVLRGAAVLMMVLSGIQPFGPAAALPAWMYHAQVPPPAHTFDPSLPGITWVDLVFPWFLFALGAALPLAFAARRRRGASTRDLVRDVVVRGGLLLAFAVVVQHVRPWVLGGSFDAPPWAWGVALLAWGLLWGAFARLPAAWPPARRRVPRIVGVAGLALVLFLVRYPDGSGARLGRFDIILVVLANMAAVGGLVVLATARRPGLRYAVLALLAAAILAGKADGWVKPIMGATVAEGLFRPYYLKYLFLVLPGAFAGEAFLRDAGRAATVWAAASRPAAWGLAALALALVGATTAGLFVRETALTALGGAGLWGAGLVLLRRVDRRTGDGAREAPGDVSGGAPGEGAYGLATWLWAMGGAWLLLGAVAEPFEGGIKKDASTFSYYFVTGGLAHVVLAGLVAARGAGLRLRLLAETGQNPMLAYVTLHNAVLPPLALAGLYAVLTRLTPTPWAGFARGLALTLATALVVAACTRRRWYWRA